MCEGTVEERIAALIDQKRALADAVVGSGEAWLSELSTAELRDLVAAGGAARDGSAAARSRRNPPGRLPAAMLRALAAELSDPGRFSRAKAYARDGAVIDIEIEPGEVRGEVQGSRYEPYVATIYVAPVADRRGPARADPRACRAAWPTCTLPGRRDVRASASTRWPSLLVLADELTIDPDVLTALARRRRRSTPTAVPPAAAPAAPDESVDVLAPLLRRRARCPSGRRSRPGCRSRWRDRRPPRRGRRGGGGRGDRELRTR